MTFLFIPSGVRVLEKVKVCELKIQAVHIILFSYLRLYCTDLSDLCYICEYCREPPILIKQIWGLIVALALE